MAHDATNGAPELSGFHLLLTGGGTGGHVFPALAVAEAVRQRGGAVSFVGGSRGFEARLVPERGIVFHALPARPVVGRGLAGKAAALATLVRSALRARTLVRRLDPAVVLGTGGYVSAPAVVGAWLARRPIVLLEPNAAPGAANRALSRLARAACVAFPEASARLRCPTRVTGVPVRQEFFAVASELPAGTPRLLLLGGSQGSQQLNRLLPAALELAAGRLGSLAVRHQTGEAQLEATRADYRGRSLGAIEVETVPFVGEVAAAMGESHLVISRAGAITLAELCAAGRGSVLVPLALAEEHQRRNAEAMTASGAARLLAGAAATPERLAALLVELFADAGRLQEMATAARALGRPNAVAAIVEMLLEVAA